MKIDFLGVGLGASVLACYAGLLTFEHRSGPILDMSASAAKAASGKVVCFVTVGCPCSVSTLKNLSEINLPSSPPLQIVVERASAREASDYIESMFRRGRPKITVTTDPNHQIAKAFGAVTAGTTYWIAANGKVAFRGGITGARGESGPNQSLNAFQAAVNGHASGIRTYPVYGCRL